jgi:hypothetical protein
MVRVLLLAQSLKTVTLATIYSNVLNQPIQENLVNSCKQLVIFESH